MLHYASCLPLLFCPHTPSPSEVTALLLVMTLSTDRSDIRRPRSTLPGNTAHPPPPVTRITIQQRQCAFPEMPPLLTHCPLSSLSIFHQAILLQITGMAEANISCHIPTAACPASCILTLKCFWLGHPDQGNIRSLIKLKLVARSCRQVKQTANKKKSVKTLQYTRRKILFFIADLYVWLCSKRSRFFCSVASS